MLSKIKYYLFLTVIGLSIGYYFATRGLTDREEEVHSPTPSIETTDENVEEPASEENPISDNKTPVSKKKKALPCIDSEFDGEIFLQELASEFEAQKILYNSQPLSDCSGIFLRFTQKVVDACPNTIHPNSKEARDGRRLAKWYYDKNRLTLVQNAKANSELIRPGAIMFYGRRNKTYNKVNINNITATDGIEHIGVVTEVVRDKSGMITNYVLFHGRSTGKIATRTTHHHRNPSRNDIPAYGNWNQQWVAVSYIF